MSYQPRLIKKYHEEVVPLLKEQYNYSSPMQVPKVVKICLNQGVGGATSDKKLIDNALSELTLIAGQKAVPTKAKKSISNFKLREEMVIGARVTLRNEQMYEFLDRLVSVALPRVRDFRGINDKSFDGRGNYTFGLKEQIVFPEIDYDKVDALRGMDVTITTSAANDEEAEALLRAFNFPLKTQ